MNVRYFEFCSENFRRNLLDLCYVRHVNLTDVAKGTGISYRTINNYTRVNCSLPNVVVALRIAEFFNVTVEDIFTRKLRIKNKKLIFEEIKDGTFGTQFKE